MVQEGENMKNWLKNIAPEEEELVSLFNRKCDTIDRRGRERGLDNVDRKKLWEKFYYQYKWGFYCSYCAVKLSSESSDDERVFTFDHYVPISRGGDNSIGNLELACNPCNSVKGRMSADTFNQIIDAGGRDLIVRIYHDYKEPMVPKVQSDNQCDNCNHRKNEKCELGIDVQTANNRDSDWCGRWNA